ncbi:MAG: PEP-CTERM sorting domain-containing protein [Pyrinomonadaceae bacterium]
MKNFAAMLKPFAMSIALLAIIGIGQGIARADEITVAGNATGGFNGGASTTLQGLSFSGSTFNVTTLDNRASLGGDPSPPAPTNVNNLGSFTLTSTNANYDGNTFQLLVTFTAPAGITGGNPATFSAMLSGRVNTAGDGGVFVDFNNTPMNFSFSNAQASGSFSLMVNDLSINPGQTISLSGNIIGSQTAAIPEPATMLLLGTGLAGVASRVRKRRKSAEN